MLGIRHEDHEFHQTALAAEGDAEDKVRAKNKTLRAKNRLAWNEATALHIKARSERSRKHALAEIEREELGAIEGLSIVHLQCNCGHDALELARMGAEVCGVDISDAAIAEARRMARRAGLKVKFVRSDMYDFEPARTSFTPVKGHSTGSTTFTAGLSESCAFFVAEAGCTSMRTTLSYPSFWS